MNTLDYIGYTVTLVIAGAIGIGAVCTLIRTAVGLIQGRRNQKA